MHVSNVAEHICHEHKALSPGKGGHAKDRPLATREVWFRGWSLGDVQQDDPRAEPARSRVRQWFRGRRDREVSPARVTSRHSQRKKESKEGGRGVRRVRRRKPAGVPAPRAAPHTSDEISTWLILPVVICSSQRLSHACLSTGRSKAKPRMAH